MLCYDETFVSCTHKWYVSLRFFPGMLFHLLQLKWKLSELVCSLDSLWYVSEILYKRLFCGGFSQWCCFGGKKRKCDNWSSIPALSFNPRLNLIQWSIQETDSNSLGGHVWEGRGLIKSGAYLPQRNGALYCFSNNRKMVSIFQK